MYRGRETAREKDFLDAIGKLRPYGLAGGEGAPGGKWVTKAENGEVIELPGKCSRILAKGDTLRIETPGGGGWGSCD